VTAVAFTKVEGLGNDFVLLDRMGLDADSLAAELAAEVAWARRVAPALCDRRTGIGADGVLLVGPGSAGAGASMTVVNFDGSRPEMCGNGLRCVAAFVADRLGLERVTIATDAGPKLCEVARVDGEIEVRIDMGPAVELGCATPVAGEGRSFAGVSIGNPHAVYFVGENEQPEELARRLGPGVELDPAYAPDKTNVEFARVEASESGPAIELWVWERGVGLTHACGTGACATVAAAARAGLVPSDVAVAVALPGGRLSITAPSDPSRGVMMRGPCRQVFSGEFEREAFGSSPSSSSSSSSSSS
jgi:diaminopimelate epimerase